MTVKSIILSFSGVPCSYQFMLSSAIAMTDTGGSALVAWHSSHSGLPSNRTTSDKLTVNDDGKAEDRCEL